MSDINQIVALLIEERDRLNRAIEALHGGPRRRGRPPKNPLGPSPQKRGRKSMSRAARLAQSRRMKKYWAERRKAKDKS
jgi:hypothetical protein